MVAVPYRVEGRFTGAVLYREVVPCQGVVLYREAVRSPVVALCREVSDEKISDSPSDDSHFCRSGRS